MTAEIFPLAPRDNYLPSKTYSAGAGREVDKHLKCTTTLPLYITLESAVSWTNFPRFCYLNFMKFTFLRIPCCSTCEGLSIDVWITHVGADIDEAKVISALRQKSKFEFRTFLKKIIQIFGFPCCSTRQDLSIDISITNVGLISTKLWWFLFSGYGQTDKQTWFWNPHVETCRHTKNFNSKLKISG